MKFSKCHYHIQNKEYVQHKNQHILVLEEFYLSPSCK